jgi:hypothetical protein
VQTVGDRRDVEARMNPLARPVGTDDADALERGRVASPRERTRRLRARGVVVRPRRLSRDHVQVVRVGRAARRGEEVVVQDVPPGPRPVVRLVRSLVLGVRVRPRDRRLVEPVHLAAVPRCDGARPAVREVGDALRRQMGERHAGAVIPPEPSAVDARESAEQVIEALVLLHDHDDVLDRPARRDRPLVRDGIRRARERRRGGGGDDARARRRALGRRRACDDDREGQ